jgi:hypothetical protein
MGPDMKTFNLSDMHMTKILAAAALACVVLAAPSAKAQTFTTTSSASTGTVGGTTLTKVGTTSTTTAVGVDSPSPTPVAPSPSAGEAVALSGAVAVSANYIPDPAGGVGTMAYFIDATKLSGTGASSGLVYTAATGQATATRQYALNDTLNLTMSFYPKTATGYLSPRTFLLTLAVTIDATTKAVTAVTSKIGNFVAQ